MKLIQIWCVLAHFQLRKLWHCTESLKVICVLVALATSLDSVLTLFLFRTCHLLCDVSPGVSLCRLTKCNEFSSLVLTAWAGEHRPVFSTSAESMFMVLFSSFRNTQPQILFVYFFSCSRNASRFSTTGKRLKELLMTFICNWHFEIMGQLLNHFTFLHPTPAPQIYVQ